MKRTTKLTLRFYFSYVKRLKGLTLLMTVALMVAIGATMAFYRSSTKHSNTMTQDGTRELIASQLIGFLGWIVAIDIVSQLAWRSVAYSISYAEAKVMEWIFNDCFEKLNQHSYNFFNNSFAGALVKKIGRMVRAFEAITDKLIFELIPLLLRTMIAIGVLFYIHTLLGGLLLTWTLIFIIFNYFLSLYKLKH